LDEDDEELLAAASQIAEDAAAELDLRHSELRQRVRLACRNHQENMLAFSMSFVNHSGELGSEGSHAGRDGPGADTIARPPTADTPKLA
jgi:hypothetical protein